MDSVVETRRGKLRGRLSEGVATFKGVPYAAPPFGANRLRPPRGPLNPGTACAMRLGLGTEPLLGRDPPQSLAEVMHGAWVAFAAGGSCGWPRYDLAHRPTMRFDTASGVVDDPLAVELALWKGVR
jgi:carboxylesterase type B